MIHLRLNCIKENFLWLPLLFVAISDSIYLVLISFSLLIGLVQYGLVTIVKDFIDIVTMIGWGFLLILVLNGVGVVAGSLTAIFFKRPISKAWKKRIGIFLISFYTVAMGMFVFVVTRP